MDKSIHQMSENAEMAASFLKSIAHAKRLMILCHLIDRELCVGELENLLDERQASVSQMLARLRDEGLVTARRDGKSIYYSISNGATSELISYLKEKFCNYPDQRKQLDGERIEFRLLNG